MQHIGHPPAARCDKPLHLIRTRHAIDNERDEPARHGQNERELALNRKNALFAGHETGAQNWALITSLIEICKLNQINPHNYLDKTLTAIANGHKQAEINQWLVVREKL